MPIWAALKNKHIVVALLVTPILAVLAWFAVGSLLGGDLLTPKAAETGQSYPLVELSGCRYGGGLCRLRNEDFELRITLGEGDVTGLNIASAVPLDGLLLGFAGASEQQPLVATRLDNEGMEWQLLLPAMPDAENRLRVVATRKGVTYFGEAGFAWIQPRES